MGTKTKAAPKKSKKRPPVTKQREKTELPGFESADDYDRKIVDAARNYKDMRDTRMDASADEKQAKDALLAVMVERGIQRYQYDDLLVMVTGKSDVQVKDVKPKKDDPAPESNGEKEE